MYGNIGNTYLHERIQYIYMYMRDAHCACVITRYVDNRYMYWSTLGNLCSQYSISIEVQQRTYKDTSVRPGLNGTAEQQKRVVIIITRRNGSLGNSSVYTIPNSVGIGTYIV